MLFSGLAGFPTPHSPNETLNGPQVPNRPPRRDRLSGRDDAPGVDAVAAVEVLHGSGFAEMLDAEGTGAVARDGAEPGESRGVPVEHGDERTVRRDVGQQAFDMASRVYETALAGALGRCPAGVEPVRGGHGEKA